MRVTLTTVTFDPLGVVALECVPDQQMGETRRRMSRVATLDGGAVFNDGGYSEADRTIGLRWVPKSADQEAAVARLVERYARLQVSMSRGVFLVATEAYVPGAAESSLSLLVVEKLSV